MSMMRCDFCDAFVDTDEDPDCFDDRWVDLCKCESCRENDEEE